jgi:hypothetical protein
MHEKKLQPEVKEFIDAILSYFHQWLPKTGSASADLLASIEDSIQNSNKSTEELQEMWHQTDTHAGQLIDRQIRSSPDVCRAFAPLRIKAAMSD